MITIQNQSSVNTKYNLRSMETQNQSFLTEILGYLVAPSIIKYDLKSDDVKQYSGLLLYLAYSIAFCVSIHAWRSSPENPNSQCILILMNH